jgi:tRNA threonylcarbamoyladenosine biosynthesis protein TsaE
MPATPPQTDPPAALRRALPGPEDTDRIGAALAAHLAPGDVVLLHGDLGAGKSALARACIRALLAEDGRHEDDIPSPSFTLVQIYGCVRGEVWHVDLYRLAGEDGCVELGLDDALDAAICLVEWPDRLGALTPSRRLDISLSMAAGDDPAVDPGRWLEIRAHGPGWAPVLAALSA